MKPLPDLLESVARLRVKVAGVFKGARREIDFTSSGGTVTITGTDDSVNEKMTLDLAVLGARFPSSTLASVVLWAQNDGGTFAVGNTTGSFVYAHAISPTDNSAVDLVGIPASLGLTYVLDSATSAITATESGVWAMNAFYSVSGGGTATGDEYGINLSGPAYPQANARVVITTDTTGVPPVSTSCVIHMVAAQTTVVYWTHDSPAGSGVGAAHQYFQLDITRLA